MIKQAKYLSRKVLERKFEAMRGDNKGLRKRVYQLEQALRSERGKLFDTFKAAEIIAIVGMFHMEHTPFPKTAPEDELTRLAGQMGIKPANVEEYYAKLTKASEGEPS